MPKARGNAMQFSIIQLIALAGVAWAFLPALRGVLAVTGVTLAVAFICIIVFRRTALRRPAEFAPAQAQPPRDLRSIDWFQFERIVAELFTQEGMTVERLGGANPDGGIDLILARADGLVAVQCKHWRTRKIGVKDIRDFIGAMADRGTGSGIFVYLDECSPEAQALAARHQIQLLNERALLPRLQAVQWQSNPAFAAILDDRRKVCPKCESVMVLRTARRGASAGLSFWGCSTYPRCHFTMPAQEAA